MHSSRTPGSVDQLRGAVVIVTGARGFIGTRLCGRLLELGAEVYGTSRTQLSAAVPGVRWITTALNDAQELGRMLRSLKPGFVFHLAGPTSADRSLGMVVPTFRGTLETTVNVLAAAAEAGCRRLVLAGSLEAPLDDGIPSSPYAAAKRACQMYARMFAALYATPVTVARIFMTYGPGQIDTRKLVPSVILSLLRGEAPKLSGGHRAIDWIYIDDVVDGLLRIAVTPGLNGDSVDLGAGRLLTVRWVVDRLVELTGGNVKPEFGGLADRPSEVVAKADVADTEAKIGWVPRTSVEEGLKSTVDGYRAALADASGSQE